MIRHKLVKSACGDRPCSYCRSRTPYIIRTTEGNATYTSGPICRYCWENE